MIKTADADQRRHLRFELFEYAIAHSSSDPDPKQVVIVNIGLGGLQLRTRSALKVGDVWNLNVASGSMEIPVEVRYCDALAGTDLFAVGLKFKPISHEHRIAIANYVHAVFQRNSDLLTV